MELYIITCTMDAFENGMTSFTVLANSKKDALNKANNMVNKRIMNAHLFDGFCKDHADFLKGLESV